MPATTEIPIYVWVHDKTVQIHADVDPDSLTWEENAAVELFMGMAKRVAQDRFLHRFLTSQSYLSFLTEIREIAAKVGPKYGVRFKVHNSNPHEDEKWRAVADLLQALDQADSVGVFDDLEPESLHPRTPNGLYEAMISLFRRLSK